MIIAIILYLLLPGFVLTTFLLNKKKGLFRVVSCSLFFSLSFWLLSFSFLGWLNIPVSYFLRIIIFSCSFILIYQILTRKIKIFIKKEDCLLLLFFTVILFLRLKIIGQQFIPAGADMSMHMLNAKVIYEQDSFPKKSLAMPVVQDAYPLGFSVLIAELEMISGSTFVWSGLFITGFTYFLISFGFFWFLRVIFSTFVALLSSFMVTFATFIIGDFISWGGNPTILSLAILLFGLSLWLSRDEIVKKDRKKLKYLIAVALIFAAAFNTHIIPLAIFAPFYFPLLIIEFCNAEHKKNFFWTLSAIGTFSIIFSLPFLTRINTFQASTNELLKLFQYQKDEWNWIGGGFSFIGNQLGVILLSSAVLGCGMFSFLEKNKKEKKYLAGYALTLPILIGLFYNSRFWVLPFSSLFHPDRVLLFFLLPIAIFIGIFLEVYFTVLKGLLRKNIYLHNIINFSTFLILGLFLLTILTSVIRLAHKYYKDYLDVSKNNAVVTQNDLLAFNWLRDNTTDDEIIGNNYGDAGLWIPVILYKPVTTYQMNYLYDDELTRELENREKKAKFFYIGDKAVYDIKLDRVQLKQDNNYRLVFKAGNAEIYKRIK